MEFNLSTNIEKSIPQAIVFNYEELKKELTERINPYKNMVIASDQIKEAKGDRASLNTLKKAINDRKIEAKKAYMTPLEAFEKQVKDLLVIIDDGVVNIDTQVKVFEEKEIEGKHAQIEAFYNNEIGELAEILPLARILPEKWKNKGEKLDAICESVKERIFKFQNDMQIIRAMNLECEEQMLIAYVRTLDMSAALNEKHLYEEQQAAIKKAAEAQKVIEKPAVNQVVEEKPKTVEVAPQVTQSQEGTRTIDVRLFDTTSDFRRKMKELCGLYNITYGSVPKGE